MTRSYPVRITQMSDTQKMNRIIDLENALLQTNERIAAAPELLEACQDAANQLRTVASLLNHIPKRYAALISPTIRYGDIDAVIAKARGEK